MYNPRNNAMAVPLGGSQSIPQQPVIGAGQPVLGSARPPTAPHPPAPLGGMQSMRPPMPMGGLQPGSVDGIDMGQPPQVPQLQGRFGSMSQMGQYGRRPMSQGNLQGFTPQPIMQQTPPIQPNQMSNDAMASALRKY